MTNNNNDCDWKSIDSNLRVAIAMNIFFFYKLCFKVFSIEICIFRRVASIFVWRLGSVGISNDILPDDLTVLVLRKKKKNQYKNQ